MTTPSINAKACRARRHLLSFSELMVVAGGVCFYRPAATVILAMLRYQALPGWSPIREAVKRNDGATDYAPCRKPPAR